MALDIRSEAFTRWCREAVEHGLFEAHWREVGRYKEKIQLEPDFQKLTMFERGQILASFTVRDNGRLVGYSMFICTPALHYMSHVVAYNDAIYVVPELRGAAGRALIQVAERELIARGASKIVYHFKVAHDRGPLMDKLGYEAAENIYEKLVI